MRMPEDFLCCTPHPGVSASYEVNDWQHGSCGRSCVLRRPLPLRRADFVGACLVPGSVPTPSRFSVSVASKELRYPTKSRRIIRLRTVLQVLIPRDLWVPHGQTELPLQLSRTWAWRIEAPESKNASGKPALTAWNHSDIQRLLYAKSNHLSRKNGRILLLVRAGDQWRSILAG